MHNVVQLDIKEKKRGRPVSFKDKKLGLEVEPRQTKHIFSIYVHFQRLDK